MKPPSQADPTGDQPALGSYQPDYRTIELAEVEGHSKVLWCFDQKLVNPMAVELAASGFTKLAGPGVAVVSPSVARSLLLPAPLLPPLEEGWEEFGLICHRLPRLPLPPDQAGKLARAYGRDYPDQSPRSTPSSAQPQLAIGVGLRWLLVFRWRSQPHPGPQSELPGQYNFTPYELFLQAQDRVRPNQLALTPNVIVPLIFLTRLAKWREDIRNGDRRLTNLLPSFYWSVEKRYPLVMALFHLWMDGSSRAAIRYRQSLGLEMAATSGEGPGQGQSGNNKSRRASSATGKGRAKANRSGPAPLKFVTTADTDQLSQFAKLVGNTQLEMIKIAERVEPAVIRLLTEAATYLAEPENVVEDSRERVQRFVRVATTKIDRDEPSYEYRNYQEHLELVASLLPLYLWQAEKLPRWATTVLATPSASASASTESVAINAPTRPQLQPQPRPAALTSRLKLVKSWQAWLTSENTES